VSIVTICVAGAESTGKSWLAARIAAHYGLVAISEYARGYCAAHGNDLSMEQLRHIGQTQDANIRSAVMRSFDQGLPFVVADTDAVVTAVWARQLSQPLDPWFAHGPYEADLYFVTDNDLPWQDDGVRVQADQRIRDRFRKTMIDELERRGLRWVPVGGHGEERLHSAIATIDADVARLMR
jgi:nicotinamide riboside kinase